MKNTINTWTTKGVPRTKETYTPTIHRMSLFLPDRKMPRTNPRIVQVTRLMNAICEVIHSPLRKNGKISTSREK
jgi:hypothetical protein